MVNTPQTNLDDFDLLGILRQGFEVWNAWRKKNSGVEIDLTNADLRSADLRSFDLSGADLSSADLSNANLMNADLSGADLIRANLMNANLEGATLRSADLNGATLSGASLRGVDLSNAYLSRADLNGADLRGVNLSGADLRQSLIDGKTQLDKKWQLVWELLNNPNPARNYSGVDLSDADLNGACLSGIDLSNADLRNADLSNADLSGTNLSGANLQGSKLTRTILEGLFKAISFSILDRDINLAKEKELEAAIDRYMAVLGYEKQAENYIEYGPLLKNIQYSISTFLTSERKDKIYLETKRLAARGKAHLETHLEDDGVEQPKEQAATAELLKAIEPFNNIALYLGKLIIVKWVNENGHSQFLVETVPMELQNKLEADPKILLNPQSVIDFLQMEENRIQDESELKQCLSYEHL